MTKEQEEARETLKTMKENIDKKYLKTRNSVAIETVLSMLEEKDKQIEKLKKHNDDLLRKLRNRVKDVKKLQKYSLYKKEFSRLNKQLQNKEKIIDLMANHIATSDSDLCEYLDITTKCKYYAGDNGKTCDNCIKQYFENKAKEVK
jgi:hypothetical protein